MPSSTDNPAAEESLVIDCSEGEVFCGLLDADRRWLARRQSGPGALEALFPSVAAVLREAVRAPGSIRRYLYCEGPGSVLGLRLGAMAIETWCRLSAAPVERLGYGSLQLTAALLLIDDPALQNACIVSDWKQDAWHSLEIRDRRAGEVATLPTSEIQSLDGPLYHLPRRKGWQAPPDGAQTLPYQPSRLDEVLDSPGLLRPSAAVELFQPGGNTFAKWNPQRHRAGSA